MDKKGLSGILTVLIIIAIALAVVGVIWIVINNLIGQTEEEVYKRSEDLWTTCPSTAITTKDGTADASIGARACLGTEEVRIVGGKYCCVLIS